MKKKSNGLLYPKAFALLAVLALSSCDKNNEEMTTEATSKPTINENVKKGRLNGQDITYIRKDGLNFFQGDIVLTDEQLAGNDTKQQKGGASYSRWPQGIVYYTIASNMGSINKDKITAAIKEYSDKTNVKWVPKTSWLQWNYVDFIFGSSTGADGWANIGYRGGRQVVSLDQYISIPSVMHEMGHSIGLYHEHTRQDRDQYVNILWDNIQSGQEGNFSKYSSGEDIGAFDINSLMMYWSTSYSKNGLATIQKADGSDFTYNRTGFTNTDIATINKMYPK
ncbi:M12 family metallopeptidase [Chryseobacterium sp. PMSZPI]|uniref:M12 family metallopeptidase n=1 Tax=Chryseobacterium sp. PMSZPI TaxID=1033900 RepID=UPI000C337F95|nr:M12 family metallopeptidase [Chryseobacterium sp. PMSZPI]PKF74410.1 hypothetical protein CW752_09450 [Chryseobacterium sp. PMSZPI]